MRDECTQCAKNKPYELLKTEIVSEPSSIALGGTSTLSYIMEQFGSMGLPAHFSTLRY